ncbi:hypothetical protein [Mycolicibacterium brisbanense]|uniref:Autotransporter beta-domain protein n=1 Tax=Mycolicibacterium brisbanense TaxID=146020 RepID=A0A100W458_9MYCO|nr:hypothetical protein [Mycolicibacterium brisbanense]MCV7157136.1 hypothetical protein [Mycolicibacterium brisbanense]GAS91303.1 autotransporter beta-domain protein [Mycolicibacterium brisbanense]
MMLMKESGAAVRAAARRMLTHYRSGPARLRLRRRLYLFSAPVVIVLLAVAAKLISVVVAGNWAASDFDRHDIDAMRDDISILEMFNVVDPAKTSFAAGDLMVLEGRLTDAEARFGDSLSRTDPAASCPVRVNLELVQETLGDLATRGNDKQAAERRYNAAIAIVKEAPAQCFAGNDDANADRKAIRDQALPRLEEKLRNLHRPPPPPSAPPQTVTPQPAPTSLTPTSAPPLPGLPGASQSPSPSPGQPSDGQQTPGGAPPPGPGPNMPSPDTPEPTMTPGPPAEGGGPDVLNPVSPDRLPSTGSGQAPGQRLGDGNPLERLKILLDNANAHGGNQESP